MPSFKVTQKAGDTLEGTGSDPWLGEDPSHLPSAPAGGRHAPWAAGLARGGQGPCRSPHTLRAPGGSGPWVRSHASSGTFSDVIFFL